MIVLDIVCLVITIVLILQGLWYGFLKGLFFLFAWIAAACGAYFCKDLIGDFLAGLFEFSPTTNSIVCLAIGFLVPFVLLNIVGRLLHGAISKTMFSIPNRILGVLLGLIKACVCCSIILTVIHILPLSGSWEEGRTNSKAYNLYLQELSILGFDTTQPNIKGFVTEKAEEAIDAAKQSAVDAVNSSIDSALTKVPKQGDDSLNTDSTQKKISK